jgi:hypothetical protein
MASLREHGRYGIASLGSSVIGSSVLGGRVLGGRVIGGGVIASGLALGCVSTDEPLFDGVAVPELRSDDRVESTAQSAAPAAAMEPAAGMLASSAEAEPVQLVLAPPSPEVAPVAPVEAGADAPEPEPEPVPAFEPCGSAGLLLCDTFEDAAPGTFPATARWLPELSGCGTHRVDDSGVSTSGVKSLRADAGGYPECMLHADLDTEEEVYVRSWVRLGPEPDLRAQYSSLLEFGPRAAQDEPELRIGLRPQGSDLCTTTPGLDVSVSGLPSGSATSCSGFTLEPERWYCLQVHVKRLTRGLDYELSVDGASVLSASDLRLGAAWNDQHWYFKVGRAAYGLSARGSLWHDDVAVGREPLPCGP